MVVENITSASARCIYGMQLKLCAAPCPPPPFQGRATSPSLIVRPYLAYSGLKINGGVECRLCMTKSLSITAGRSPDNNVAMAYCSVVDLRHKQESNDAWRATHQWISFNTDAAAKLSKDATYFCL